MKNSFTEFPKLSHYLKKIICFLFFNFKWILKLVHFKTLNQFSFSSFEIREFNNFNQILLGLFDVSYVF